MNTLLSLIMPIGVAFLKILALLMSYAALLLYYAARSTVTWLLAAAGFLGWRVLVWAWAVTKK
jgi:hypothetical protein